MATVTSGSPGLGRVRRSDLPHVDIREFASTATLAADAGAAINTALAQMPAGWALFLVPATYLFATEVVVDRSNIEIFGIRGSTIIQGAGDVRPFYLKGSNIRVHSLSMLGDRTNASYRQNQIVIGGSGETPDDIVLSDISFENSSSSCVLIGSDNAACSRVVISDCNMLDFYECAVDTVSSGNSFVRVSGNFIKTSSVNPNGSISRPIGIAMEPQNSGVNADFIYRDNIIDFSGLSTTNRNLTNGISVNKHSTPAANFILKRFIASNNIIRGAGYPIYLKDTRYGTTTESATLTVVGNQIEAARNHGILVAGGEDATHRDSAVVVGNTIKGYSESSSNTTDGIHLDQHLYQPVISGNVIGRRVDESGAANGRYGVNIASANVVDPMIGDNPTNAASSGRINDASSTASIGRSGKAQHFYTTSSTITGDESLTPASGSVLVRTPSGADRSITPSTTAADAFANGQMVFIVNAATSNFRLIFDPSGINVSIPRQSCAAFVYNKAGTAWVEMRFGSTNVLARDTAANIAAVGATINTANKYLGKLVQDTTNKRLLIAAGSAAADAWDVVDGSASVTPA